MNSLMWRPPETDYSTVDAQKNRRWAVVAPFFTAERASWIVDENVSYGQNEFEFVRRSAPIQSWHEKAKQASSITDWFAYRRHAHTALSTESDGYIALFPQLAATLGSQMRLRRDDAPLISWFFNTTLHSGGRARSARAALSRVDRFVVHSTAEIDGYARDLDIPRERFEYVPLQYGGAVSSAGRPDGEPYLFATGSGFRDYATMFAAVKKLNYRTLVLAGPRALSGLEVPSNVEIIDAMPKAEIHQHVLHAKANVLPLSGEGMTAGLVTIVEAFRHGRSMVGTHHRGVEDYLVDDETALLAQPGDVDGLAQRLEAMWTDRQMRERLDSNAAQFGDDHCTDAAASAKLLEIIAREIHESKAA